jgi:hypothetical protein
MPATIMIYGSQIIEHAPLPIGQLSEEAQEARNKDFKRAREFHLRKCSRFAMNEDELHYRPFSSDPLIFSFRKFLCSKVKEMFQET